MHKQKRKKENKNLKTKIKDSIKKVLKLIREDSFVHYIIIIAVALIASIPLINLRIFGTDDGFVCMSRARRFGKTMMTNLMSAYYSKNCDSREIFENLKLSKQEGWDMYLNSINVIQIDLQGFYSDAEDKSQTLKILQECVVDELREQFPTANIPTSSTIAKA